MSEADDELITMPIVWKHTGDAEFPYTAEVRGRTLTIRINDFPAEPLYTVIAEENDLFHLDDWPSAWTMPAVPQQLLELLAPQKKPKPS